MESRDLDDVAGAHEARIPDLDPLRVEVTALEDARLDYPVGDVFPHVPERLREEAEEAFRDCTAAPGFRRAE